MSSNNQGATPKIVISETENINKDILCLSDNSKIMKHILTNKHIKAMTVFEKRYPITKLPMCGHCEKPAFWSKTNGQRTATCMDCGTITSSPITLSEYLVAGYDLPDSLGAEKKAEIKARREAGILDF